MSDRSRPRVCILDVPVDDVTLDEAVEMVEVWLGTGERRLRQIATVNPEFIVAARRDADFRSVLHEADLTTPDGIGVLIAARLLGQRLRGRVTGVDLVEALAAWQAPGMRLFFLGAGPGIAERAAAVLRRRFAGVQIAGVWEGSPRVEDFDEASRRIRASGANVLLVAYGAPAQDIWIARHRTELGDCGIVVAMGVGGTFDFLAGAIPRAPRVIRRAGFEWLYRLIRQPWRWRRQLALPWFVALVLSQRLRGSDWNR